MRDDDVLDIRSIELGEELLPQALDGGFNVIRSEWPLGRPLEPRIVDVLSRGRPYRHASRSDTAADQKSPAIHL
jgi:hypothetical protein